MFSWDDISRNEEGKINLLYRHQRIFDEGLVKRDMKALDIGGWGVLASRLLEEGVNCTILDIFSEDQYYPDRVKSLPHVVGDITCLDSCPGVVFESYDLVTCFEMLEHCNDQKAAVNNIYMILKPGGVFVGTFPLPGFCHFEGEPDVNFLNTNELFNLLEDCGFTDVVVEPTPSIDKNDAPCSLYFKGKK